MKFSLIALHLHSALQFTKSPHFVQSKLARANGDVINVNSGGANGVTIASTGEGDKRKLVVNVTVSTGPGLYTPVVIAFGDKADQDRANAGIVAALEQAAAGDDVKAPEVVAPTEAGE